MPAILDPHRPRLEGELDIDTRVQQARDLDKALEQASDYGQYLWRQLRGARLHLLDMLPMPDADDPATRTLTSPRGPGDDEGWERWQFAYDMVTSSLAGPHGDEGFARREAAMTALDRRGPQKYSARTAELVDLTTERVVRAREQLAASDPPARSGERASSAPGDARRPTGIRSAGRWPAALAAVFIAGVLCGTRLVARRRST